MSTAVNTKDIELRAALRILRTASHASRRRPDYLHNLLVGMNSWDANYVQLNLYVELDEFKSCKSDWQSFASDFYASLYNSVNSIDSGASDFKKILSVMIKNGAVPDVQLRE